MALPPCHRVILSVTTRVNFVIMSTIFVGLLVLMVLGTTLRVAM